MRFVMQQPTLILPECAQNRVVKAPERIWDVGMTTCIDTAAARGAHESIFEFWQLHEMPS